MRYAVLLYVDPTRAAATTPAEARAELSAYAEITQELATAGVLRGGEAFMPARTAQVVRVANGSVATVPAPPSDLELSGFYIVACEEKRALEIAARMPVATHGAVEVRPLMELPEPLQP
jgi:hypothetical protein